MSHELLNIKQQLQLIERQMNINAAASNFVIKHLIDIISEKFPNEDIIEALRESLERDISRVNSSGISDIKKAINNILQKPVQEAFKPKEPGFIK